jgi:Flp pilus assembly protein TadG
MIRGNQTTGSGHLARMRNLIARFRRDRRGNIAIMMALSAIPLVGIVGCVVDYTMATAAKTKLQASADAATLAAVSMNSTIVANAQGMGNSTNGAVPNGTTYLQNIFNANAATSPAPTITSSSVTKSSNTVTAAMSYSAQVSTAFLGVLGFRNITVTGSSTASYTWAVYVNFYVMLDVSGSMSFPSTPAEQARLMAVNPDNLTGSMGYPQGCQFACHFTAQGACQQNPVSGWQVGQGPIPRHGPQLLGLHTEPKPRWILSRIHYFALGDHAHVVYERYDQHNQRKQRQLDQYAGQFLCHGRNKFLHPTAGRRHRGRAQPTVRGRDSDRKQVRDIKSIPDRAVSFY